MSRAATDRLDFDHVDDVAFAEQLDRLDHREIPSLVAMDFGPYLELCLLAAGQPLLTPKTSKWLLPGGLALLARELESGRQQWVCPHTHRLGFYRTRQPLAGVPSIWTGFGLAVQKAAARAEFPPKEAAQLAAALGELHSNIYEHSEAAESGILGFQASSGRIEIVAADQGIGVLNSLRTAPEYAALTDHGQALVLAAREGVSRFGQGSGRGCGFRPIFVGLANLKGALRFRSGDHALLIDGRHSSLTTARRAQKPSLHGFMVSVVCEATALA